MRQRILIAVFLFSLSTAFAQKLDSLQQVQWDSAIKKLKSGDFSVAEGQFTQLINSGFPNKEIFVKRGVAYYNLKEYAKAKADLDEGVKARINTAELFEHRGNSKYNLDDYQGAATDLEKAVAMGANSLETFTNLGNAKFLTE